MDDASANSRHMSRLNPFVFFSDTDFRFVLLVVSVLGVSIYIYQWLFITLFLEQYRSTYEQCSAENAGNGTGVAGNAVFQADQVEQQAARLRALNECLEPLEQTQAIWVLAGVTVVLIAAGVIYWTAPMRRIRRERLVPLSDEDAPEVVVHLTSLCDRAGFTRPPTFMWDPLDPSGRALAFGRVGIHRVALGGGLVAKFYKDPPAFDAVVLHELAHLRNADVDKTYLAVASWQAFIIVSLAPFAVGLVYQLVRFGSVSFVANAAWRVLVLAAFVYLARNAVLRVRELYADIRALVWDGPESALGRVLATLPRAAGSRWRLMARVHPDPEERRRMLEETSPLFRMEVGDAFAVGVATTIAFSDVANLFVWVLGVQQESLAYIATASLLAPLAVGAVGLGVWRGTFAALSRGEAPRGAGILGLGLGFGLIAGNIVSFSATLTAVPTDETQWDALLAFNAAWGGLVLASLYLLFRWVAAVASLWLGVATTRRSLRLIQAAGLIMAAVMFAPWLSLLLQSFSFGNTSLQAFLSGILLAPGAILALTASPFTFAVLVGLWAFPMGAWFWRHRASTVSDWGWAFLDSSPQRTVSPLPLRLRTAVVVGLVAGLLFWVLLVVARVGLHFGLAETVQRDEEARLAFSLGRVALAVLVQAAAAAISAALVIKLGWLHGLCSAFVAGCIAVIGEVALYELSGCVGVLAFGPTKGCSSIDLEYASLTLSSVINGGALLAVPVALGVSAVASWTRRRG